MIVCTIRCYKEVATLVSCKFNQGRHDHKSNWLAPKHWVCIAFIILFKINIHHLKWRSWLQALALCSNKKEFNLYSVNQHYWILTRINIENTLWAASTNNIIFYVLIHVLLLIKGSKIGPIFQSKQLQYLKC